MHDARRARTKLRLPRRGQTALAALGHEAIASRDRRALMDAACGVVADVLRTDRSAVLELMADDDTLVMRSGFGWDEDAELVLEAGAPLVVQDVADHPGLPLPPPLARHGVASMASVIIGGRHRPWGTLGVYASRPRSFGEDEIAFLESVASVLALAIERDQLERREMQILARAEAALAESESRFDVTDRKRAEAERDRLLEAEQAARADAEAALERLRAIESITDSALHQLGLDELLGELLRRLRRALNTDSASVQLLTDDEERLYPRAVDGYRHEGYPNIRVQVGKGVTGWIAAHGRPLIVDDYSTVDLSTGIEGVSPAEVRAMVASVMGAPLRIGEKVVGVVAVNSSQPRRFTEEELKLLGIVADRVAPAIELGRLVERVRSGRERQKVLARRLLTAQEEERRRLAVEMHDELGQVLTAAKINLASLESTFGGAAPSAHLREAIDSVDRAMDRVRDIALALRPSVLDDLGLPAALRWYADRLARDAGLEAHLSIDAVPRLEPELETACFRVAQEALTNIARHAHGRRFWLELHLRAGWLELTVRDDGIGFETAAARERALSGASMGLLGMQERVTLLGGEYRMTNVTGGGAEVRARLPIRKDGRGGT